MDAFLIVVAVIACLMGLLVNVYIVAIYSHREEPLLAPIPLICRLLAVFMMLLIEMNPLFLVVDAVNSRTSTTSLTLLWTILFFASVGVLGFLKPLCTSLYQSDEDDPAWKRAIWVLVQTILTALALGLALGLGWTFWGKMSLSVPIKTLPFDSSLPVKQFIISPIQIRLSLPCFVAGLFCLVGYIVLSVCGSVGLSVLPISLCLEFKNRPKLRRSSQARQLAQSIKSDTVELLREAKGLQRQLKDAEYVDGWMARRRKKATLEESLTKIEEKVNHHAELYGLFQLQLQLEDVNIFVYIGKLLLGVICGLLSVLLVVQILLSQVVAKGSYPVQFLEKMLIALEEVNANFVGVGLLLGMGLMLSVAVIRGSAFVSAGLGCIVVHPLRDSATWLNSLLFQLTLCLMASFSLTHLLVQTFPTYLRGGQLTLLMGTVASNMNIIGFLLAKKVFTYLFLAMWVVGLVLAFVRLVCCQSEKSDLVKLVEEKRAKIRDRQIKGAQIEMTLLQKKDKKIKKNRKDEA